MAYTFKVYAPNASGTTVDMSANPPAAGDILVAWSITDTQGASQEVGTIASPDPDWTKFGPQTTTTDSQTAAFWIKETPCVGGETSFDIDTNASALNGAIAIGGVDQTTQLDVSPPAFTNQNTGSASPATLAANSITPVTNGSLLVALMGPDVTANVDATMTFSGGGLTWTTRADHRDGFRNAGVGTAEQTTAAAITVTGSATFASGNAGRCMFVLALRNATPPSGGGGIVRQVMQHEA
jgi:hypothetical protein